MKEREQLRTDLICGQVTGWLMSLLPKTGKTVDGASSGTTQKVTI